MRLDDDTYFDTPPSHSNHDSIGEIKFVIARTTIHEKKIREKRPSRHYLVLPQKVHERSKKATAHQVKYVVGLTLYNA